VKHGIYTNYQFSRGTTAAVSESWIYQPPLNRGPINHRETIEGFNEYKSSCLSFSYRILPRTDIGLLLRNLHLFARNMPLSVSDYPKQNGERDNGDSRKPLDKSVVDIQDVNGVPKNKNWEAVIAPFLIACYGAVCIYCAVAYAVLRIRRDDEKNKKNNGRSDE
jgi:hypothetical protein